MSTLEQAYAGTRKAAMKKEPVNDRAATSISNIGMKENAAFVILAYAAAVRVPGR